MAGALAGYKRTLKMRRKFPKSAGVKALVKVNKLSRTLQPEVKPFDAGALYSVNNSGTVTSLLIPSQGTTYINRDGIKIKPRTLIFRAQIEQSAAASISFLRIIFFRGVREAGTTFAVTDILQTATMDSPLVWLNRDRFTMISDRVYSFSDTNNQGIFIKANYRLKKFLEFTGNATGVQNGGVYMLVLSNEPTNAVSFDWHCRTTFTDS